MTYELSDKIKNLKPYNAVTGDYKIRMDANESFINPGETLQEEFLSAVASIKFNRYPNPMATELCEGFARYYGIDPEMVVAGNGSDELISIIMGAFLRPGDKVMSYSPDFSMYQFYGNLYDKTNLVIDKKMDMILTAADVLDAVMEYKPAAVILSNPCSPTSLVMSREDILKIVENSNNLVIIDEAYMDFSDQSIIKVAEKYDNLILLKTCSKALGLAAIRLGFAVASKPIARALHAVRSPYNVNAITQEIGRVIFSHPDYIKKSIEKIKEARDQLYSGLLQLEPNKSIRRIIKPDTNFVFIELSNAEYVYKELKKYSIIVRQFGDFLRITTGTKEENEALIQAISKILV
ncbi:MAG: histidinol-phosphate transaminase [Anaerovoracaceae bacterium]|jgi:histidinol-phosphate aminotransferase